jgi:two-component system, cell cycle sensor histidine kinase and response regulator CckA
MELEVDRLIAALRKSVLVLDSADRLVVCNSAAEQLFGLVPQSVDSQPRPLPDGLRVELSSVTARARAGARQEAAEFILERGDGTVAHVEARTTLLCGGNGETAGMILVEAEDVTETKRLEATLRHAQREEAIGRLAGGIAHDFNNNLACMLGCAEMISRLLDDPGEPKRDRLRAYLRDLVGAAENATKLTRQLLAFGRRQVMQPRPIDCNALVTEMKAMLQRLIGENIEVVSVLDPTLAAVLVDPAQLEQVLLNLTTNARDAMPHGGRLTFETRNVLIERDTQRHPETPEGHYVSVVVSDTGTGISEEVLRHLFEPFFTTKAKGKGSGLGLATVYGIIKQSGGHILAYSELGRGATFKILLPRVDAPAEPRDVPRDVAVSPSRRESILLIEDDAFLRRLIAEQLRMFGHDVVEAETTENALSIARQFDVHLTLLLTDMIMPQMSGLELAHFVRLHRPGLKVLCMSGYADVPELQAGSFPSEFGYIQKPFKPSALAAKINEVMGHQTLDGPPSLPLSLPF